MAVCDPCRLLFDGNGYLMARSKKISIEGRGNQNVVRFDERQAVNSVFRKPSAQFSESETRRI